MKWIVKLISDSDGNPSSKRITGFAILFLFLYFGLKSINVEIDKEIFWGVFSALLAQNGILLTERLGKKK